MFTNLPRLMRLTIRRLAGCVEVMVTVLVVLCKKESDMRILRDFTHLTVSVGIRVIVDVGVEITVVLLVTTTSCYNVR